MKDRLQLGYRFMRRLLPIVALTIVGAASPALAKCAGSSGGLTLIEAPGARAAGLGEAFSAAADDVTAAAYNPASLATLSSPQISLSYQKGIADDAFGRVHAGRQNLGVSVSYYSAGDIDLLDGSSVRNVNAQTDLSVALAGATTRGRFSLGAALKFLSSQLVESDRATAYAFDLGVHTEISPRLRLSSALQNIGTALKFIDEGDPLPRIFRLGAGFVATRGRMPLSLSAELPYFLNEKELRPAVGAEILVGPMAFRAGYRSGSEIEGLSLGAGFATGGLSVDYAFGFVDDLDSRQRISLGYRFGGSGPAEEARLAAPAPVTVDIVPAAAEIRVAPEESAPAVENPPVEEPAVTMSGFGAPPPDAPPAEAAQPISDEAIEVVEEQ